jgi:hypothetical protein
VSGESAVCFVCVLCVCVCRAVCVWCVPFKRDCQLVNYQSQPGSSGSPSCGETCGVNMCS